MVSVLFLSCIFCFHKMKKNKVCVFSCKNDSAISNKICPYSKTSSRFKETTAKVELSDPCWISNVVQTLYYEGSWLSKDQPWSRVELRTLICRPDCFYFLCLNLKSLQNKVRSFSLIFFAFPTFFHSKRKLFFSNFHLKILFSGLSQFPQNGNFDFLKRWVFQKENFFVGWN